MEIRCTQCEHLGAASEARPVDAGVGLVCAQCGHVNVVATGEEKEEDEVGRDGDVGAGNNDGDGAGAERSTEDGDVSEASLEGLIPEPGDGQRCRKCAHLFKGDREHCPQCGLSVAEAQRYPKGEAPWEQGPPGKEEALQTARQLWEAATDDGQSETMEMFVDFVIDEELVDFGIRNVQHFLVDHRGDEEALRALRRLAKSLEVAVQVARSRAAAEADEFHDDVKRVRSGLLVAALVFWTVILLLFSWLFWDKF